jgi:hypothetical protein
LLGREYLVFCPRCKREVIPVVNPHDTISGFCPQCNKPITNLGARKYFEVGALLFLAFVVAVFFAGFVVWTLFEKGR